MIHHAKYIFLYICLICLSSLKAEYVPAPPNTISVETIYQKVPPEIVKKVEQYWNSFYILVDNITQTNPDGTIVNGKIYLKKGNGDKAKMRVDYQEDYKQKLLIKESEVLIVDLTDGAVSAYPVSMTPASLILKPRLNFETDVKIIDSRQIDDDIQNRSCSTG
jgi:outer membrane lipoprotein-sorting protein